MVSFVSPKAGATKHVRNLRDHWHGLRLRGDQIADLAILNVSRSVVVPDNQNSRTRLSQPTKKIGHPVFDAVEPEDIELDFGDLSFPKHFEPSANGYK